MRYLAYILGGVGPIIVDFLDPLFECSGMLTFAYDIEEGKEVFFPTKEDVRYRELSPSKWFRLKNGLAVLESRLVFTEEFQDFTSKYTDVKINEWINIKKDFIKEWVVEENS